MEIYRKDSEYVVRIDLPWVNRNDVQVHTERNLPTITRERKTEERAHDYPETCYDNFERTLTLPQSVEADEIVARYQHGVLEIRVPLSAKLAGRKIPIQIEQQANRKLEPKATQTTLGDSNRPSAAYRNPLCECRAPETP